MTSTDPGDGEAQPEVDEKGARGRVRIPEDRRKSLLDEFERSGMSGAAFARRHGIKYATFASWVNHRRKARRNGDGASPARFLVFEDDGPIDGRGALSVQLPHGCSLSVSTPREAELAARLIQALGDAR